MTIKEAAILWLIAIVMTSPFWGIPLAIYLSDNPDAVVTSCEVGQELVNDRTGAYCKRIPTPEEVAESRAFVDLIERQDIEEKALADKQAAEWDEWFHTHRKQ